MSLLSHSFGLQPSKSTPALGDEVAKESTPGGDLLAESDVQLDDGMRGRMRDVWAENLDEEFANIRSIVADYPYIAMDTEFPGIVARPIGEFKSGPHFQYNAIRCNVNVLKLIQCGLTFFNEKGEMPPDVATWQFNFKFNLADDMYAQDSIDLLHKSGIKFSLLPRHGVRIEDFGELLTTSGLVLSDNVHWLSFHSGYDFGYIMRTIMLNELPVEDNEFFELLAIIFPHIYDIKTILKQRQLQNSGLRGGLQELADMLGVQRVGVQHQAGSDSLLTGLTFFKLKEKYFGDDWSAVSELVDGQLFGLADNTMSTANSQATLGNALVAGVAALNGPAGGAAAGAPGGGGVGAYDGYYAGGHPPQRTASASALATQRDNSSDSPERVPRGMTGSPPASVGGKKYQLAMAARGAGSGSGGSNSSGAKALGGIELGSKARVRLGFGNADGGGKANSSENTTTDEGENDECERADDEENGDDKAAAGSPDGDAEDRGGAGAAHSSSDSSSMASSGDTGDKTKPLAASQ